MPEKEKLRLDKYLWAIRLFKTRALSTEACSKGKVKINGDAAKPARPVHVGDQYEVKTEARKWKIQVTGLLHNRVQYAEAVNHYLDITPAEETERLSYQSASFNTGKRQSKTGRPSKKQRRELGDFMED